MQKSPAENPTVPQRYRGPKNTDVLAPAELPDYALGAIPVNTPYTGHVSGANVRTVNRVIEMFTPVTLATLVTGNMLMGKLICVLLLPATILVFRPSVAAKRQVFASTCTLCTSSAH